MKELIVKNSYSNIERLVLEVLHPIVEDNSCELVDIKYMSEQSGKVLRIYLDKQGGVTVDDCADVSRELSVALDAYDIIPHSYTLEVSSPGLRRPLLRREDYDRFKGKKIRIKMTEPIEQKKMFVGTLVGTSGEKVIVKVDNRYYELPFNFVGKANLEIDFGKGEKK